MTCQAALYIFIGKKWWKSEPKHSVMTGGEEVCPPVCICVHLCAFVCICVQLCAFVCIYRSLCASVCVSVHPCVSVCIYAGKTRAQMHTGCTRCTQVCTDAHGCTHRHTWHTVHTHAWMHLIAQMHTEWGTRSTHSRGSEHRASMSVRICVLCDSVCIQHRDRVLEH